MNRAFSHRRVFLGSLLIVLLGCADVWAWSRLAASRRRMDRAETDLFQCNALVAQISAIKKKPNMVQSQEVQAADLAAWVEKAAAASSIPSASLIRITPEPLRRIGDTSYSEKSTQLQLRSVDLKQILTFLSELVAADSGLRSKSVRLSAPRDQDSGSGWNVETTVYYLVYLPRNTENPRRGQP